MTTKIKKRGRLLSWVPAVVVIGATIVTVAGISLIPSATGATTTVQGTVSGTINIAPCGATTNFGANFVTTASGGQVSPACSVGFDTNSATGGALSIADNDGAAPFFCTGACTAGTDLAFENVAAGPQKVDSTAGMDDTFGFTLSAIGGAGSPATDVNAAAAGATANNVWYPVGAAATQFCHTPGPTAGATCDVEFGGEPSATQQSGNYSGVALITAYTT